MKKLVLLVILVAVCAGAYFTCPDKKAHKKALTEMAGQYVEDKVADATGDNKLLGSAIKGLRKAGGNAAISLAINTMLEVDNYYLFSVGKLVKNHETKYVSLGAFGYVATPTTSMIDWAMEE